MKQLASDYKAEGGCNAASSARFDQKEGGRLFDPQLGPQPGGDEAKLALDEFNRIHSISGNDPAF